MSKEFVKARKIACAWLAFVSVSAKEVCMKRILDFYGRFFRVLTEVALGF